MIYFNTSMINLLTKILYFKKIIRACHLLCENTRYYLSAMVSGMVALVMLHMNAPHLQLHCLCLQWTEHCRRQYRNYNLFHFPTFMFSNWPIWFKCQLEILTLITNNVMNRLWYEPVAKMMRFNRCLHNEIQHFWVNAL